MDKYENLAEGLQIFTGCFLTKLVNEKILTLEDLLRLVEEIKKEIPALFNKDYSREIDWVSGQIKSGIFNWEFFSNLNLN